MSNVDFPVTTSNEYKNISLLLSALTHGAILESPFRFLALSAFGLSYSTNPASVETLTGSLKKKLLAINAQSEFIADETEALGFAAHVLFRQQRWDKELQQHQDELINYFEGVANLQWLRSEYVAMSFLLGFGRQNPFLGLAERAKEYLLHKLPDTNTSMPNLPVVAFGLYQGGVSPEIPEMQIRHWLNRTHQQFHYLGMLAVTLKACQHQLAQKAITYLQEKASLVYTETVEQNISLVGVLLSTIRMAEMGQSDEQITEALKQVQTGKTTYDQISAVITAGSKLFAEFSLNPSNQAPLIEGLAFYLFAANKLGLTEAYIIDDQVKKQFIEFARVQMGDNRFKAVSRNELAVLIIIAFLTGIFIIFRVWWPVSDAIYNWVLQRVTYESLKSVTDELLTAMILVPIYFILGATLSLWFYGQVRWSDIKPGKVKHNVWIAIKELLGTRGK